MTVDDIMTSDVITAGMDDTVGGIAKIFERHHIHHIPVVEGTRIVGVVSDRDVLKAISPFANTVGEVARDSNTLKRKAHQVMTRHVVTICPTDTALEAALIMLENRFNCLPVLSNAGALVGIVTKTDLLKSFVEQVTGAQV
ncbi:MAG: CBS domain-containing protein [Planctomycetes bacterium]|nr:CBS domain-containing protein [Planctomycetota bacterium]